MNYINNFVNKGHDCIKNAIYQMIPQNNSSIEKIVKIGKKVFSDLSPHALCMTPGYLSRLTNMRGFSVLGMVVNCFYFHPQQLCESWLDVATTTVLIATNILSLMDMLGKLPLRTDCRIAIDSLYLLAAAIQNSRTFTAGWQRMFSSWNAKEKSTTFKVSRFISGAILTTFGVVGMRNSFQFGTELIRGVKILHTLDSVQKSGILKHRALHTLSRKKSCNAVIIDGMGRTKSPADNLPTPFSESFYEHCKTRTYSVENSNQFCEALRNAKTDFDQSIDFLSLNGHANNTALRLDENYFFQADQKEISCLKDTLSSNAQVFLVGCNTATSSHDALTLTEKVSTRLPGIEVTGFSSFYNPLFTKTSFSKKTGFLHDSYFPLDLNLLAFPKTIFNYIANFSTSLRKIS